MRPPCVVAVIVSSCGALRVAGHRGRISRFSQGLVQDDNHQSMHAAGYRLSSRSLEVLRALSERWPQDFAEQDGVSDSVRLVKKR